MVYAIYDYDSDGYDVEPSVEELSHLDIEELYDAKRQRVEERCDSYWRRFKIEWIVENRSFRLINKSNEASHVIYCAEEEGFESEYSKAMKEYKKRIIDDL